MHQKKDGKYLLTMASYTYKRHTGGAHKQPGPNKRKYLPPCSVATLQCVCKFTSQGTLFGKALPSKDMRMTSDQQILVVFFNLFNSTTIKKGCKSA